MEGRRRRRGGEGKGNERRVDGRGRKETRKKTIRKGEGKEG